MFSSIEYDVDGLLAGLLLSDPASRPVAVVVRMAREVGRLRTRWTVNDARLQKVLRAELGEPSSYERRQRTHGSRGYFYDCEVLFGGE